MIQKVGEHEIRDTGKGLNVAPDVWDDVLVELLKRAAERYEGGLTAYGSDDFQLRLARKRYCFFSYENSATKRISPSMGWKS